MTAYYNEIEPFAAAWLRKLIEAGHIAPDQPGVFPLATGIPNRVGMLRGAGNAIAPPVAQAFIAAYMGGAGVQP